MGTLRLQSALHEIVDEDLPETSDLWPAVRERLKNPRHRPRFVRAVWPRWAPLTLVLAAALGTAAYVVITAVLDRAIRMDPSGSQYLAENGLVEKLDLSQTENGVTATVHWAYADANRVLIAYTIAHPADRESTSVTLTDEDGEALPSILGAYGYADNGLMGEVRSYDAGPVRGEQDVLRLRLHMEVSTFNLPKESPTPPPATVEPETGVSIVVLEPTQVGEPVATFDFQFSLPFHPAQAVTIGQVAEHLGIAITLVSAVIAPSDTRFDLCFTGLDPSIEWIPIVTLDTPGIDIHETSDVISGGSWLDGRCYRQDFGAPLADHPGAWKLTVVELVGDSPASQQIRIKGPWGFRFSVP
jgi:hypothetical protein